MNSLATTIDTPVTRRFVPATKLRPPQPRAEHFWRPQLFERLDAASSRPVTLISAPTGFGKTTLLSTWASLGRQRIAWLTVSKSDSDTVRLMAGIVAALRRAGSAVGDDVDRNLAAAGIDVADQVLPRLLDTLDGDDSVILILDDFHLLRGAAVHELVASLLADMPESLRVIISTRADPVMPLGRLRATGALAEIRADQLRFDVGEADRFLNGSLRLDLDRECVETLEARTEGWPAGLYLAALTLQGRSDRAERARFVSEFAGSSHHVVDYLGTEVMQGLSPDDRAFLLRSSILGRMNGPLCDAVTGMTGSAGRLLALEKANLFIIPLDDNGTWFRFHRLFAELLRANLASEPRELELDLHRRAAAWHADLGSTEAAVEHALAAGDREWAATLLAQSWRSFARTGEFQTFDRLITSTGPDRGRLAGPLAAVEAMMSGLMGRDPTVVGRLIATAEASGWEGPTPDGHSIDSIVAIATAAFCADDLERQKAAANHLIRDYHGVPELEGSGRASLGMVLAIQGDAGGAIEVLEPIDRFSDYPNIELYASAARSLATMELGDPVRAEALARAALRRADEWGLSASRVGGALWLALGSAVARRGRPREALPPLERALSQWGVKGTVHRAAVLIELASALGATGEPGKARAAAREAREILVAIRNAGAQPARLAAVERRLRMGLERAIPQGDVPSEAETRVLRLMSSPLSAREIAGELYISINTVKTHTKSLHMKLGTSSREETVARARELGLL